MKKTLYYQESENAERRRSMEIELSKQASKVIARLDKSTKQRIKKELQKIPDGNIVTLQGASGSFRACLRSH